jgi:hypothetical protein
MTARQVEAGATRHLPATRRGEAGARAPASAALGLALFAVLSLAGWHLVMSVKRAPTAAQAQEPVEALVAPYPPGHWRFALPTELASSKIWFSHLLVAHRDAASGVTSFDSPEWRPSPPLPRRSRREAFALAKVLARWAQADPTSFASLAKRSDDVVTRDTGGSLGGMSALELSDWPEALDALAALRPGEVSRVVETDFGFHVFLRRAPPPETRVSGARLVLAYDQAPWLRNFLSYRPVPSRSRTEALELARRLYQRLREDPRQFAALVREYSEHRDALRDGDFGDWSTLEPTPFPREVETLAALSPGEVAPPLDSAFGIEILMRTTPRERETFTMAAIERPFTADAKNDDPTSLSTVTAALTRELPSLLLEPAGLAARGTITTFVEGRGDAADEAALRLLAPGEMTPKPVVRGATVAVLERLAPRKPAATRVLLDLPSPPTPDLAAWLTHDGSARLFESVEARAIRSFPRSRITLQKLASLTRYGAELEQAGSEDARASVVNELERDIARSFPADLAARYRELLTQCVAERLMLASPHPGRPRVVDRLPLRLWPVL